MRQKKRGSVCIYEDSRTGKWKVQIREPIRGKNRTRTHTVATRELADIIADHARKQLADKVQTVGDAITSYLADLEDRDTKKEHRVSVAARLALMFPERDGQKLTELHPIVCQQLYDAVRRKKRENGKPYSNDYHRNALLTSRSMCKWLVKQGAIIENPFKNIDGIGKRRRGKKQLTIDEARTFMDTCLAEDSIHATAALCCLLLAMRAGEIVKLTPRDIDDGGRVVRVEDAKTEAGDRLIEVPDVIQARLPALAGAEYTRHMVNHHVHRLCKKAGVEDIGPHALRGTHASMATRAGASSQLVAQSLGHASPEVTQQHYTERGAIEQAAGRVALTVLAGGRSQ